MTQETLAQSTLFPQSTEWAAQCAEWEALQQVKLQPQYLKVSPRIRGAWVEGRRAALRRSDDRFPLEWDKPCRWLRRDCHAAWHAGYDNKPLTQNIIELGGMA